MPLPKHERGPLKTILISDSTALGLMEERPEPAWRVKMTVLRTKDLLAPDYGAMHVAAFMRSQGIPFRVVNLLADVHTRADAFVETESDPDALSGSSISSEDSAVASRRYLLDTLAREKPQVILIGLSVYNLALHTRRLLADIKEACPEATLVTGGIYSTFHAEEILSDGNTDVVIRGEGEVTSAELLRRLEQKRPLDGLQGTSYRDGGIHHNEARAPISDLDILPHQYTVADEFRVRARFEFLTKLLPEADWIAGAGFLTSRGCPEGCTFCLDPAINGRRTRFHSPEYVRDVLDYCAANFSDGRGSFFFGDATFTMNKKRLGRILDFLPELPFTYQIQTRADYLDDQMIGRLAAAGVTNIAIGAETFNAQILREVVRKRLDPARVVEAAEAVRSAGMRPMLTFIVGLPGETRESILRTVDVLEEHGLHDATFFPLVVFRGTELYDEFVDRIGPDEAESLRLNPVSEEFLGVGDEFPTAEELTGFTDEVNKKVLSMRASGR